MPKPPAATPPLKYNHQRRRAHRAAPQHCHATTVEQRPLEFLGLVLGIAVKEDDNRRISLTRS
ncbi:MAG: hypothetical protein ABSG53_08740 [Thermoguttaceae bacterium]